MAARRDGSEGEFAVGGALAERVRALVGAAGAAEEVALRVTADMGAMLRRFGLDAAELRRTEPLEMLAAETRCASCGDVGRCHGFLDGAPDEPEAFCPNAASFAALRPEG